MMVTQLPTRSDRPRPLRSGVVTASGEAALELSPFSTGAASWGVVGLSDNLQEMGNRVVPSAAHEDHALAYTLRSGVHLFEQIGSRVHLFAAPPATGKAVRGAQMQRLINVARAATASRARGKLLAELASSFDTDALESLLRCFVSIDAGAS